MIVPIIYVSKILEIIYEMFQIIFELFWNENKIKKVKKHKTI